MTQSILIGLTIIVFAGILAHWLAWRLRLPSILLLLIFGILAGPVFGFFQPDALFGELLFPLVSLAVAVILFEGGLTLKFAELRGTGGPVVRNMVSIGILITWAVVATAAYFILDWPSGLAVLFGAIMVVTGPTVILPILRHVKPKGQINSILKWEGILNDPIGAMLAVLVFEGVWVAGPGKALGVVVWGLTKTLVLGSLLGLAGAAVVVIFMHRNWVPDFLHNSFTLMLVVCTFTISNVLQHESGLFTVTLMGIALANQKWVPVKHIIEFKENLRVLLIATLFIILAARLDMENLASLGVTSLIFLGVVMFVARPMAVIASSFGSGLSWQERVFLSWLAPRGIVAAAVSALFALRLEAREYPQAEQLVPVTFLIIIGTIAIQGWSALHIARWLGLAQENPQGSLIIGAHRWSISLAQALQKAGFKVILVDTNWNNITAARLQGLPTFYGNILSENIVDDLDLDGIGRLLAVTPNDEVNSLAALHFADIFGAQNVYQLATVPASSTTRRSSISSRLRGQILFDKDITHSDISGRMEQGATIKLTSLTNEFTFDSYCTLYGDKALPLFLVRKDGTLGVFSSADTLDPKPGQAIIGLVHPSIAESA